MSTHPRTGRKRACARLVLGLLTSAVFLAACGGPPANPASTQSAPKASPQASAPAHHASFPVTLRSGARRIDLVGRPQRIVSLSATATESLFAIGAGDQVVAADDQSDYPPEAPRTALSGHQPNVEAILTYRPDLVVASNDTNKMVTGITRAGVPILVQGAAPNLRVAYAQILQLGRATGHLAEAKSVVRRMKGDIATVVEAASADAAGTTYYHELDPTFFSVTSKTFIGQLYALFGLHNIADAAQDAGDYPQLSPELIIEADPDVIFLADSECCGITPRDVTQRPGWQSIRAVRTGAIVELDEDLASRWGPRIPQHMQAVADALERVGGTS